MSPQAWVIIGSSTLAAFLVGFVLGLAYGSRYCNGLRRCYQHLINQQCAKSKAIYIIGNAERAFESWRGGK